MMWVRRRWALTLLLLALPVAAQGQPAPPSVREEMRRLDFLVGEWKGKGWLYSVKGSKADISQTVKVTMDADGSALRIRDRKSLRGGSDLTDVSVLHPEGAVIYDEQTKQYRWRVKSSRRRGNPFEVTLPEPRTFRLVVHTPDSMFRTTIRVTEDGAWHETLEVLLGEGWFKTQETVLKQVK